MIIYTINVGLHPHLYFTTKDLAKIKLYSLADVYRKFPGFKLGAEEFSYESDPLPEDDGSNTIYTTRYYISTVDVIE